MLFAVAIFLVGVISSQISSQSTQSPSANNAADKNNNRLPNEELWHWLTHDAAGFFTLVNSKRHARQFAFAACAPRASEVDDRRQRGCQPLHKRYGRLSRPHRLKRFRRLPSTNTRPPTFAPAADDPRRREFCGRFPQIAGFRSTKDNSAIDHLGGIRPEWALWTATTTIAPRHALTAMPRHTLQNLFRALGFCPRCTLTSVRLATKP